MRDKVYITFKAKLDTATAIIAVCRMVFVVTAPLCVHKCLVFRSAGVIMRRPLFKALQMLFQPKTPTRDGVPRSDGGSRHADNLAAFTLGIPKRIPVSIPFSTVAQNSQATKLLSSSVNKSPMRWFCNKFNSIFGVVHSVFSYQKMVWARLAKDSQGLWRAVFIVSNPLQMRMRNMQEVL